jgi:hypothetical protein
MVGSDPECVSELFKPLSSVKKLSTFSVPQQERNNLWIAPTHRGN